MTSQILAIDQGTTSSRALVFDENLSVQGLGQQEFTQHYPAPGHVEHDADEIWRTTLATAREAIARAGNNPTAEPARPANPASLRKSRRLTLTTTTYFSLEHQSPLDQPFNAT